MSDLPIGRRRPRGWAVGVAASLLTAVLLAGCSVPPGTDGLLTDDWPDLPEATLYTPNAGACHFQPFKEVGATPEDAVACASPHRTQTIHVGAFTGAAAKAPEPPPRGSPAFRVAYSACATAAFGFLGDDWRSGRLWLGVGVPSPAGWAAGGRWFRCDLEEVAGSDDPTVIVRDSTLADALRGARPVALTCFTVTSANNSVAKSLAGGCDQPHNTEFVGVADMPASDYRSMDAQSWVLYHSRCRELIAEYVGVSRQDAERFGTVAAPFSEQEWERGNRGVRCHLWLEKGTVSSSLRGSGAAALPAG